MLALALITLACVLFQGPEAAELNRANQFMDQGRYGDAVDVLCKLESPQAKVAWALLVFRENQHLRARGVKKFHPDEATTIIRQYLSRMNASTAINDPDMYVCLSSLYTFGLEVPKDASRSFRMRLELAENGGAYSSTVVGIAYLGGEGVKLDPVKGMAWLRKGEAAGDMSASVQLGHAYLDGILVPLDLAKSLSHYQKAADKGSLDGMIGCSSVYLALEIAASDVPDMSSYRRYRSQEAAWLTKAVNSGAQDFQKRLDELVKPLDAVKPERPSAKVKVGVKAAEPAFKGITVQSWKFEPATMPGRDLGILSMDLVATGGPTQAAFIKVTTRDKDGKMLETGTAAVIGLVVGQPQVLQALVKANPLAVKVTFTAMGSATADELPGDIPIRVLEPTPAQRARSRR